MLDSLDSLLSELKLSYKKLKSSVYYDKTQLVLRNKIVEYEGSNPASLEINFMKIANILMSGSDQEWEIYKISLLNTMRALTFPKIIYYENKINQTDKTKIDNFIANEEYFNIPIIIDKAKYFIDIHVEAHILGVLWILTIGKIIEEGFYEDSYGNRLDKKLSNEAFKKFSPYLFKPYFFQYESWRDIGLKHAEKFLDANKDVIILTMDFQEFYHSLDFNEDIFRTFINGRDDKYIERINTFVFEVLKAYSALFEVNSNVARTFLPIGFLPSNILSNWYLDCFDRAICTRLNPIYYGRYVDDIIFVEKVERNSLLYNMIKDIKNRKEKVIDHLFCNCKNDETAECTQDQSIFKKDNKTSEYKLNPNLLPSNKANVTVQNAKVKLFYFNHKYSRALLTCFRNSINNNKSEFRYLPNHDNIMISNDYSDIYELSNCDSINKLRGVESIEINKFRLSKYLGKLLKIGNIIDDNIELEFVKDINKIFTRQEIIDNYTTWEKVIEHLVLENKYDSLKVFYEAINKAINDINDTDIRNNFNNSNIINIKETLGRYLYSVICRSFSHNWGSAVKEGITKIYDNNQSYLHLLEYRKQYLQTRMCDKYIMPTIIDALGADIRLDDTITLNMSSYFDFVKNAKNLKLEDYNYCYHPYIIHPDDISISLAMDSIKRKDHLRNSEAAIDSIKDIYVLINSINKHINPKNDTSNELLKEINCLEYRERKGKISDLNTYIVKVGDDKKDSFHIAIANARLFNNDFKDALKDHPNLSSKRYDNLYAIVKEAVKNKVDMLVLPESYLPFGWIKILSQIARKNQMAIITGVEHIKSNDIVYNLVATILPYKKQEYQYSLVTFHTKVHYSPAESDIISGYRLDKKIGNTYDMFVWNDLWFATYCCYELASIHDRSLFMAYVDMLAVVEWNKDTNYYSNIIESLSRDIHCYCVQVNTSNYGDSRVTQPSKTETRDIIRTKGGINSTVLIGEINIDRLRDFQYLDYSLQKLDDTFKPTPPNFNRFLKEKVIKKKIDRNLWESISNGSLADDDDNS